MNTTQPTTPTQRRCRLAMAILATSSLWMTLGCQDPAGPQRTAPLPTPDEVARMATEPNVGGVAAFYDPYTFWIWTEDKSRVRGIKVGPVYLIGPKGKGVFGDGIIRPKLFFIDRDADGKRVTTLAKEWSFTVEEAIAFRLKARYAMGWAYGLPLVWGDLDLAGREIRIVTTFERSDGGIVTSSKRDVRVPLASQ